MVLCVCYAISGTDVAYDATAEPPRSNYGQQSYLGTCAVVVSQHLFSGFSVGKCIRETNGSVSAQCRQRSINLKVHHVACIQCLKSDTTYARSGSGYIKVHASNIRHGCGVWARVHPVDPCFQLFDPVARSRSRYIKRKKLHDPSDINFVNFDADLSRILGVHRCGVTHLPVDCCS